MTPLAELKFLKNWRIKLSAFLVAIVCWFAIVTESKYQYVLDVHVVPVNLPEGKILVNKLPPTATVRFEGRGKALLALRFGQAANIKLDLSKVTSEANLVLKDMEMVIPRRDEVVFWKVLSPDTVFVRLDYLETKKIPVITQIDVETIPGYTQVGNIKLTPDSILISGSVNTVRRLNRIMTRPVAFKNQQSTFSSRVELAKIPDSLNIMQQDLAVDFTVDIQKLMEDQVDEVPIYVENAPGNRRVTPRPSTVKLTIIGGEQLIMGLDKRFFKAVVDYKQRKPNSANGYKPRIEKPDGVEIARVVPQNIKLEIQKTGRK